MPGHDLRILVTETETVVSSVLPDTFRSVERWGSPIEREVRRRIHLCIATYAYEVADRPIMSDAQWDEMAQLVNPKQGTCHPLVDEFFITEFSPMTGLWIHKHPQLDAVKQGFERFEVSMRELYLGQ